MVVINYSGLAASPSATIELSVLSSSALALDRSVCNHCALSARRSLSLQFARLRRSLFALYSAAAAATSVLLRCHSCCVTALRTDVAAIIIVV